MSNKTIKDYADASGIDATADYFLIQQNSTNTYRRITRNVMLGTTGTPVDTASVQTISNKILDNTNTITVRDGVFTLQDDVDLTKQARFQLSGITTATTRTYTLPNASSTLADIATSQTFTNKTFASPVISGGSIDNTTITVDAISGHTTPSSGTVYGLSISSGKVGTNGVITASITNSAVDYTKVATGFIVQVATTNFSAVATGTTTIPEDDTIPQITEGTEFMTLAITPKATTNHLLIRIKAFVSQSAATNDIIGALFQDATANALAAQDVTLGAASGMTNLVIEHDMVAGTTSATTFRFRAGPASAATLTFNGFGGARKFGGITLSSITIFEYKV